MTIIHTGDCRAVLKAMQDQRFDVVLADPPYGETSLKWDRPVLGWASLVLPLLKPHGSMWVFGSLKFFVAMTKAGEFDGWQIAQDVVWEKHNGSSFHADRFRRVHEIAVQFYPASVRWADIYKAPVTTPDATKRTVRRKKRPAHMGSIGAGDYISQDGGPRLARSVIYARSCHGSAVHRTQKPERIVEPLLLYSCPSGGTVLDPFAGSGTTAIVANRLGFNATLIEADPKHVSVAETRLNAGLFREAVTA